MKSFLTLTLVMLLMSTNLLMANAANIDHPPKSTVEHFVPVVHFEASVDVVSIEVCSEMNYFDSLYTNSYAFESVNVDFKSDYLERYVPHYESTGTHSIIEIGSLLYRSRKDTKTSIKSTNLIKLADLPTNYYCTDYGASISLSDNYSYSSDYNGYHYNITTIKS